MTEDYELVASNTLEGEVLRYIVPLKEEVRGPGKLGGTSIATNRPTNNVIFSLQGKTEEGTLGFTAIEIYDPDAPNADRSNGTLQNLIDASSGDKVTRLQSRFGQDSSGDYIVRTIREQRAWLRDYVMNPGLNTDWTLFGPTYDYRTVDNNGNNTGTPVFVEEADIEPNPKNPARGRGIIRFKVGRRI